MGRNQRTSLAIALRQRYQESTKAEKSRSLDEFVAVTGFHRKYATRVLLDPAAEIVPTRSATHKKVYDEAVKEALVVLWEAWNRICGKRLKAIIPVMLASLEGHNRLKLDAEVRERVLAVSAATIDRLLRPIRTRSQFARRKRPAHKTRAKVAIKTFANWDNALPGSLEMDFVAHCGGTLTGSFIHSLVVTDIYSGWTEATPLLMREQSRVVEGLEVLRGRSSLPGRCERLLARKPGPTPEFVETATGVVAGSSCQPGRPAGQARRGSEKVSCFRFGHETYLSPSTPSITLANPHEPSRKVTIGS